MDWSSLILFLVAFAGSLICFSFRKYDVESKFLGFSIALSVLAISQLALVVDGVLGDTNLYSDEIAEWGHIIILAFILSSLTIFIRHSKPDFAQFPRIYALLPFLIVFSYFLVYDTYTIKEWLISIYQAGGILVALLMYSVYAYKKNRDYLLVLGSIFLFLIAYLLYWYVPPINDDHNWIIKLIISAGIGLFIYGYYVIVENALQNEHLELDSYQKNLII